jgi:hypothetical protein
MSGFTTRVAYNPFSMDSDQTCSILDDPFARQMEQLCSYMLFAGYVGVPIMFAIYTCVRYLFPSSDKATAMRTRARQLAQRWADVDAVREERQRQDERSQDPEAVYQTLLEICQYAPDSCNHMIVASIWDQVRPLLRGSRIALNQNRICTLLTWAGKRCGDSVDELQGLFYNLDRALNAINSGNDQRVTIIMALLRDIQPVALQELLRRVADKVPVFLLFNDPNYVSGIGVQEREALALREVADRMADIAKMSESPDDRQKKRYLINDVVVDLLESYEHGMIDTGTIFETMATTLDWLHLWASRKDEPMRKYCDRTYPIADIPSELMDLYLGTLSCITHMMVAGVLTSSLPDRYAHLARWADRIEYPELIFWNLSQNTVEERNDSFYKLAASLLARIRTSDIHTWNGEWGCRTIRDLAKCKQLVAETLPLVGDTDRSQIALLSEIVATEWPTIWKTFTGALMGYSGGLGGKYLGQSIDNWMVGTARVEWLLNGSHNWDITCELLRARPYIFNTVLNMALDPALPSYLRVQMVIATAGFSWGPRHLIASLEGYADTLHNNTRIWSDIDSMPPLPTWYVAVLRERGYLRRTTQSRLLAECDSGLITSLCSPKIVYIMPRTDLSDDQIWDLAENLAPLVVGQAGDYKRLLIHPALLWLIGPDNIPTDAQYSGSTYKLLVGTASNVYSDMDSINSTQEMRSKLNDWYPTQLPVMRRVAAAIGQLLGDDRLLTLSHIIRNVHPTAAEQ